MGAADDGSAEEARLSPGQLLERERSQLKRYLSDRRSFEERLYNEHVVSDSEFVDLLGQEKLKERGEQEIAGAKRDETDFFNLASAKADFSKWGVAPRWSPQEAVALSLGSDPDFVNSETLMPHVKFSPFRRGFSWRLELVHRALDVGDLVEPIKPSDFMKWARSVGIQYPPEIDSLPPAAIPQQDKEEYYSEELDDLRKKLSEAEAKIHRLTTSIEDLPPKSQASLLKLVLGMAVARFEYCTPPTRSVTAKLVSGLLDDLGLKLDEDSTRVAVASGARTRFTREKPIPMPQELSRSVKPKSD